MNYHYIDYMLKERKRQELDECRRIQALKAGGYENITLPGEFIFQVKNIAKIWRSKLSSHVSHTGQVTPKLCTCVGSMESEEQESDRLDCPNR